jgi:uncharacterized protein YodC (DUF2158 family)
MTPIKPGDQVRIKSGGPMMTVSAVEDDVAVCIWFEGKTQKLDRFNLVTLLNKADLPNTTGQVIRPRRSNEF